MIEIDRIVSSQQIDGLWLIVEAQGKIIKLSGDSQKLSILKQGLIYCRDDLSQLAEQRGSHLWQIPELAVVCIQINRLCNDDKINPSTITPELINDMQREVARKLNERPN